MGEKRESKIKAGRIKVHSRLIAGIVGVCLVLVFVFYIVRYGIGRKNTGEGVAVAEPPILALPFQGGSFESSGVAYVPGSNGVLFVDDSRPGEVFWAEIDELGRQMGDVRPIQLGVSVADPEAITFDGAYFYIVGSQSDPDDGEKNALARFAFDHKTATVSKVEVMADLRTFLFENVPDLKGRGEEEGKEGGLNIEGIAWNPVSKELLLGLRSPLIEDQALVVPIRLKRPNGPFSTGNLELATPQAIRLRLGDLGIRDIHYDTRLKSFLIIAGAPKDRQKGNYMLCEWGGPGDNAEPRKKLPLDPRLKPEGITRIELGGKDYLFVVYDASSYMKLDYPSE